MMESDKVMDSLYQDKVFKFEKKNSRSLLSSEEDIPLTETKTQHKGFTKITLT